MWSQATGCQWMSMWDHRCRARAFHSVKSSKVAVMVVESSRIIVALWRIRWWIWIKIND